ncbi:hypothetical protein [Acinetobacter sp. YH12134]|uniref:hypothetical protein n=1 Tax=Acinetobacter sp. YH12134 TaxID=2601118 RepID=UPI0015D31DB4|nr:hypothetical protein [Acinetobacter sp. YH12134]
MPRSIHLPLYDEFLELFDNHTVQNWEAKKFWEKINIKQASRNEKSRRLMYSGLKVLRRCKYLSVASENTKKGVFLYSETPRLNELRGRLKKQKLEGTFNQKKLEFLDQIQDKENNIEFLQSLLVSDSTLEKYFIKHKEKLENDIRNINSNIKLMDDILNKL